MATCSVRVKHTWIGFIATRYFFVDDSHCTCWRECVFGERHEPTDILFIILCSPRE